MSQFRENVRTDGKTDGKRDGRTDGQTLFYRTLPAQAGGSKIFSSMKDIILKINL